MSKVHNLHSCDLCVQNYLLFPGERKWYTRSDLATHKRKGDLDDKSHKGHPECEFCRERYLDDHELYKHLRKKHFLCHICEADDGSRDFIDSINDLVRHYKRKHFYCENVQCQESPMESVFRSELDLKIHAAEKHGVGDKKDLRIDVGASHRDHQKRQIEIEEEINIMVNQPTPNVADQESFPSLGDKKGKTQPLTGNKIVNKSQAQTTYRSLSSKNINSNEDFPSLGGAMNSPLAAKNQTNWNNKAKQNNKQITKPKKKTLPVRQSTYVPTNPASALAAPDPGSSNWSVEPDKFVEKSQLQLQAEREAMKIEKKQSRPTTAPKKQDFPTLGGGGGGSAPSAFWGVPGNSIQKSGNTGKKKKVISAGNPKIEISNKKTKVNSTNNIPVVQNNKQVKETVVIPQRNYNPNSASEMSQRMSGSNSEWSAPPEVFHEKSLLEIEKEKKKNHKNHKKQPKPRDNDFPSLGGASKTTENGFWGVPGNSIPKSNSGKKRTVQNKTNKTPAKQMPKSPVQTKYVPSEVPVKLKKEKKTIENQQTPINEAQQASILVARMSGGNSGWSAPPDVFKEKTLLEIEEEKKIKKNKNKSKKQAPTINDSSFPTLGGGMSESTRVNLAFEYRATKSYNTKYNQPKPEVITPNTGSVAKLLRNAKNEENKKIQNAKNKRSQVSKPIPVRVEVSHNDDDSSDDEFIDAVEEFPVQAEVEYETESESEEEECDMNAINQRLMAAIREMDISNQQTFKISSGRYRTGAINACEYIELGCILMGKSTFVRILPDLIKTLPAGKHKIELEQASKI
jgi:hypothetical protein